MSVSLWVERVDAQAELGLVISRAQGDRNNSRSARHKSMDLRSHINTRRSRSRTLRGHYVSCCHQVGPKETSFGTLGPSLYQFGKLRGYGEDIQKYVWSKIYNAKATNLCSQMPRLGHSGTLTEKQIKDLVALLMDPNSTVNKD